jgi:hypothetical protein
MEIDLKPWDMNSIGHVFRHRWTVITVVAMIWTVVVTVYVISDLRPHGYLQDETGALLTWLGWVVGGGLLLAWVVRNYLLPEPPADRMIGESSKHAMPAGEDGHLVDPAEDADRRDACGLRMGVAGFGYYCGAIRTDDD